MTNKKMFWSIFGKPSNLQAVIKSLQQENETGPVYTKKWIKLSVNISIIVSLKQIWAFYINEC